MNRRERVLSTMRRESTDRIVTVYKGTQEVDDELMKYLSVSCIDELLSALGADYNHFPFVSIHADGFFAMPEEDEGVFRDIWGIGRRYVSYAGGKYLEVVQRPLENVESVAELEHYPWPDPAVMDYSNIEQECEKHADASLGGGDFSLFERLNNLRGMEKVLMDFALNPEFVEALLEKVFNIQFEYAKYVFGAAKGKIDFLIGGDDLGTQRSLLMSPDTWRRFLKPYLRTMYDFAHQNNAYAMMHCDGAVGCLLAEFIECGLDLFDPLMPTIPEMNPYGVVPKYAEQLAFHGTIDVQHLLPIGSPQQVKTEVKRQIETLYPCGGLFLAPSHCIQPGTPVENILAVYEAVKECF